MSLNVSSNIVRGNMSVGPGVLFLGVAGTTPTTDVGAIAEDGASIEISSEKVTVFQGVPRLPEQSFYQQVGLVMAFNSVEWNFDNILYALGAGATTQTASEETYVLGGEPCPIDVALHFRHQMACNGQTLDAYIWRAQAENGNLTFNFTLANTPHNFEYRWMAMRAETDWAGDTLPDNAQLWKLIRQLQ